MNPPPAPPPTPPHTSASGHHCYVGEVVRTRHQATPKPPPKQAPPGHRFGPGVAVDWWAWPHPEQRREQPYEGKLRPPVVREATVFRGGCSAEFVGSFADDGFRGVPRLTVFVGSFADDCYSRGVLWDLDRCMVWAGRWRSSYDGKVSTAVLVEGLLRSVLFVKAPVWNSFLHCLQGAHCGAGGGAGGDVGEGRLDHEAGQRVRGAGVQLQ